MRFQTEDVVMTKASSSDSLLSEYLQELDESDKVRIKIDRISLLDSPDSFMPKKSFNDRKLHSKRYSSAQKSEQQQNN